MCYLTLTFWKKTVALTVVICIFNQIVSQSVFALTSGPNSPETSGFEPVDTTDLVNPVTGDLTYNLPLIELPGPEGGYPLSLSYHAGIQPNQDASWVGLGWTLNPGSINRNINGFPDDWNKGQTSRRDYWEGGKRTTSSIGFTVPFSGNVGSASLSLEFTNDTYKGFGMGWEISGSFGIPKTPFQVTGGIGKSAETSDLFLKGGIGVQKEFNSFPGLNLNYGLTATTNFKDLYYGLGLRLLVGKTEVLGANMSSNGIFSSSVAGISTNLENSSSGQISLRTKQTTISLYLLDYSRRSTRYWSDETEATYVYGSLYTPYEDFFAIPDNVAYDGFSFPEENKNIIDYPNPNGSQGGSYPNYDNYLVTAQGLGGYIRPYQFRGEVKQQNHYEAKDPTTLYREITYYQRENGYNPPQFRFVGDFSNNYLQDYPDYASLDETLLFFGPPWGDPIYDNPSWLNGYSNGRLAGSKNIIFYTTNNDGSVNDVFPGKTFIQPVVSGLNRKAHTYQATISRHIAGFSITNESGVTYHYNLPAYSYDEEVYQQKKDLSGGLMFNRQTKQEGYAYTWHLTAITGSDYVDRGTLGVLDDQDYGYWVSFEYGKWSDKFVWRNPSEGSLSDDDSEFLSVSMGKKEVYYLNAMRTRSHVALFEKDVKLDGKGASPLVFGKNYSAPNSAYTNYDNNGIFDVNSSQTMRLDKVYLFNVADVPANLYTLSGNNSYHLSGRSTVCSDCEIPDNILDKKDVDIYGRQILESKALRIIDFNYTNKLAKETANSYEGNTPTIKSGKLTLNSVDFRGNKGISLLPPVIFDYDQNPYEVKSMSGTLSSTQFQSTGILDIGDMIETLEDDPVYCGVVVAKSATSPYIYTLRNGTFTGGPVSKSIRTTKNPAYNKDAYDLWGFYKSDYIAGSNENVSRATSLQSNASTDAWCLTRVVTATGAELRFQYEGDTYGKSVLNRNHSLIMKNVTNLGSSNYSFSVDLPANQSAANYFSVGNKLDLILLKQKAKTVVYPWDYVVLPSINYNISPTVTAISGNTVTMKVDPGLNSDINLIEHGQPVSIVTGNVKLRGGSKFYGGGIRVKSMTTDDLDGTQYVTSYNYLVPGSNTSSGVTSYEPVLFDIDNVMDATTANPDLPSRQNGRKNYRKVLYQGANNLLYLSREIPSPGILYEYVTVTNKVYNSLDQVSRDIPGKTEMQFEVFHENWVGRTDATPPRTAPRSGGGAYFTKNIVLKKFVTNLGALRRLTSYGSQGNKINETVNAYLHDGLELKSHDEFMNGYEQKLNVYKKIGLVKERYSEAKLIWNGVVVGNSDVKATLAAREEFPAVLTGQYTTNYVNNSSTQRIYSAFDFYSGAVTLSSTIDNYGNIFSEESLPAYHVYPTMGLYSPAANRKSMLTQEAGHYTYNLISNQLVSATAQVWKNSTPVLDLTGSSLVQNDPNSIHKEVWRKAATYQWLSPVQTTTGLIDRNTFVEFNWTNPLGSNANWKKLSEITLFDIYSSPLESVNINGHYSTMKPGYKNAKALITGNPGKYDEFAFSSAEDLFFIGSVPQFSGNVLLGGGIPETGINNIHTGQRSIFIPPAATGFTYNVPIAKLDPVKRAYVAALWVKAADFEKVSAARLYYKVDNNAKVSVAPVALRTAGGWYIMELNIPASALTGTNLVVGCENTGTAVVYADDFRFQPANATSTAYVYDYRTGELTYALDENNLFVKFEYDAAGRLVRTFKEVIGKSTYPLIKEIIYNYKGAKR